MEGGGGGRAHVAVPPRLATVDVAGEEQPVWVVLIGRGELQRGARRRPDRIAAVAGRRPALNPGRGGGVGAERDLGAVRAGLAADREAARRGPMLAEVGALVLDGCAIPGVVLRGGARVVGDEHLAQVVPDDLPAVDRAHRHADLRPRPPSLRPATTPNTLSGKPAGASGGGGARRRSASGRPCRGRSGCRPRARPAASAPPPWPTNRH